MAYFQIKSPSLKANIILAFILPHPPPKYLNLVFNIRLEIS